MKKIICLVSLLLCIAWNIQAMDWNFSDSEKLTVKSTVQEGTSTNATLQDEAGRVFSIIYSEPVSATQMHRILTMRDTFFQWPDLKINGLRFSVEDSEITAGIGVESMVCNGMNFSPYLPAGLTCSMDNALRYNFRMVINNVFVKIQGGYSTFGEMTGKMIEAFRDPTGYSRKREPEYILMKLEELEKKNIDLKRASVMLYDGKAIKQEEIEEVVKLKNANQGIAVAQIKKELSDKNIKLSNKQITAILALYFGDYINK